MYLQLVSLELRGNWFTIVLQKELVQQTRTLGNFPHILYISTVWKVAGISHTPAGDCAGSCNMVVNCPTQSWLHMWVGLLLGSTVKIKCVMLIFVLFCFVCFFFVFFSCFFFVFFLVVVLFCLLLFCFVLSFLFCFVLFYSLFFVAILFCFILFCFVFLIFFWFCFIFLFYFFFVLIFLVLL